jgi:hypothetical protein
LSLPNFDHKKTAGHISAIQPCSGVEKEPPEKLSLKILSREKLITAHISRAAYKLAKENHS